MKKIFFFTDIGFSKRDYERFQIEKLKKIFDVYIIDLTSCFQKLFIKNRKNKEKVYKLENYILIENIEHCLSIISSIKPEYAFDFISETNQQVLKLKKFLKKKNVKLVLFQIGLVPSKNRTFQESLLRIIFLVLKPFSLYLKLLRIFKHKLNLKKLKNISYDFIFVSGIDGVTHNQAKFSKKIIYSHSLDYEKFLNFKPSNINQKNYLIFLDQNLPFHSAQFFRKEKPQVSEAKYYPALHNTFLKLEKKFQMEVVIAPHPRADISKYKHFFKGRKVSNLDTIELVKKSNGVLAHTSTSVSFAVIYRKPIIFLTSNEIIQSYDDYRIHNSSRILNSELINIDNKKYLNNINLQDFALSTDRIKYDLYFKNYIKHPDSKNISMINLIENNLR